MPGDRLTDIGKTIAPADASRGGVRREGEDGHAFARVVAATPSRIAAVIGRDDQKIARLQPIERLRQLRIEGLKGGGIAPWIAAMAVEHVEIDEIGEQKPAVLESGHGGERRFEERLVAHRLDLAPGARMRIDVADLANRHHLTPSLREPVEQGRRRRRYRIILAVAGAREIARIRADKGPGDDAADIELIGKLAG